MSSPILVPADELRQLSRQALEKFGLGTEDAKVAADVLVEADLLGIETHGTKRLRAYVERILRGGVNTTPTITVTEKSPALAIVDGDGALGPIVGTLALNEAMNRARAGGIAYVGCRNSNHFGAMAPYGLWACRAELISIIGTNASTAMAPWRARELRMGNNPICFAAPRRDGPHFILDFAQSVAARGKMRVAAERGEAIPEGWALDADGNPTTDPDEGLKGFVLPIGEHKGYGLALAVDLLAGVLSGGAFADGVASMWAQESGPQKVSHFFILIDPDQILGLDAYYAQIEAFAGRIKGARPIDPAKPVLLPGEIEAKAYAEREAEGIPLDGELYGIISALAKGELRGSVPTH